jgi:hypothetical protein
MTKYMSTTTYDRRRRLDFLFLVKRQQFSVKYSYIYFFRIRAKGFVHFSEVIDKQYFESNSFIFVHFFFVFFFFKLHFKYANRKGMSSNVTLDQKYKIGQVE